MNNYKLFSALGLCTVGILPVCNSQTSQKQRPNIIYIMSDDHGYQAISAYGNNLYLDNVKVLGLCPTPTGLTASGITASSALLNWTENGLASTY